MEFNSGFKGLIPSDIVECITETLTQTEKLHNDLPVIMIWLAKMYV